MGHGFLWRPRTCRTTMRWRAGQREAAHGDIMAITMTRFRWALLLNSLMVATATGESRLVDFYTGSQLHIFCQGENVPTCIGYILGVTTSRSPLSLSIAVNAALLPSSRSETETRWLSYVHSRCRKKSRGNVTAWPAVPAPRSARPPPASAPPAARLVH